MSSASCTAVWFTSMVANTVYVVVAGSVRHFAMSSVAFTEDATHTRKDATPDSGSPKPVQLTWSGAYPGW